MSDHTDDYTLHPIGPWRVERVHEETVGDTGCAVGIDRITDARDRSTWRMWMRTRDGVVHPQCDAKTRKAALDAMKREAAWITREAKTRKAALDAMKREAAWITREARRSTR